MSYELKEGLKKPIESVIVITDSTFFLSLPLHTALLQLQTIADMFVLVCSVRLLVSHPPERVVP